MLVPKRSHFDACGNERVQLFGPLLMELFLMYRVCLWQRIVAFLPGNPQIYFFFFLEKDALPPPHTLVTETNKRAAKVTFPRASSHINSKTTAMFFSNWGKADLQSPGHLLWISLFIPFFPFSPGKPSSKKIHALHRCSSRGSDYKDPPL